MPTYFRNKLYSDEEKEKLWVEKLDKQERWVGKQKIDVSKTEGDYIEAVRQMRVVNRELGFPDMKSARKDKEQEEIRRQIIQETRGYGEKTRPDLSYGNRVAAENGRDLADLPSTGDAKATLNEDKKRQEENAELHKTMTWKDAF